MRTCRWCSKPIPDGARVDSDYDSKKCRQAAFRLRRRRATDHRHAQPMRVSYADPPYPGHAARYYRQEPTYAGEVDYRRLIARLELEYPDGWALSTSEESLRWVLPLCPASVRTCPWVKPLGVAGNGLHHTWEPLLVVGGRQQPPGVRDWLRAMPARGGGDLPGRKPIAFWAWLFDCLGMVPGDTFDDLFPGTGQGARAWADLSSRYRPDARRFQPSLLQRGDGSGLGGLDASAAAAANESPGAGADGSDASPVDGGPSAPGLGDRSPGSRGDGSPVARANASPLEDGGGSLSRS